MQYFKKMKSDIFISIICPVYNEEKYITPFLESIIAQDYSHENMEVFIIDGDSCDNTIKIISEYCSKFEFIKYLENKDRYTSYAMNLGVKVSKGEFIIRLDAHAQYPKNYFSSLIEFAEKVNADNVGGICITLPANNSTIASSIAFAMSHPFGVGNSMFRIGSKNIIETDTVPFGCFRRNIFNSIGYFDTNLLRNEDDEFNARIIKNGGKIFLNPKIIVKYYGRENLSKMAKMFYQYGFFKPLVNIKNKSVITVRQIIPSLFILFLIIGAFISMYLTNFFLIYVIILAFYLIISLTIATKYALMHRKLTLFFLLPITFFTIHLSYACGYFLGIFKFYIMKQQISFAAVTR